MSNGQDPPAARVGQHVRARRKELGLSVSAAADLADIARGTWISLENGTRQTLPHLHAAIERVLEWQPGSIELIKVGQDPILATPPKNGTAPPPTPRNIVKELRAIADNPHRSQRLRDWARSQLREIDAILAADQAEGTHDETG